MTRRPIVAGNIKMFLTIQSALELFREVWRGLTGMETAEVVYFPPFTVLHEAGRLLHESPIEIGGQNMHWADEGAFTGEISPRMLLDAGCRRVLIGHSERRSLFGETDEGVNRKVRAALTHGLKPMICVGETLAEREGGLTDAVLARQIDGALAGLTPADLASLSIAYEPVWAIGTGRTATPEMAADAHRAIRNRVAGLSAAAAGELRILYGGSVKPENARGLLAQEGIDGALVGGACLSPGAFLEIVRAADGRAS